VADILSQEEIDALLSALSSGEVTEEVAHETQAKTKTVKTWDFHRPDRFSKDQTRTLQMLHEQVARFFMGLISMHLRSIINVKLISVDQLTYDEFIRSLPNPTCLAILNMNPLDGQTILEISPAISFAFVDRMMGGQGAEFAKNRELTEIEQALLRRIVEWVSESLSEAWVKVIELKPSVYSMETNPQMYLQAHLPSDMVILLTFDVSMGQKSGTMGLCIPHTVVEPIMDRLSTKSWHSSSRKTITDERKVALYTRVYNAILPVIPVLGTVEVSVGEILNLKVGDTVELNRRLKDEIDVYVGAEKRFAAKPGVYGANKGVKITQVYVEDKEVAL